MNPGQSKQDSAVPFSMEPITSDSQIEKLLVIDFSGFWIVLINEVPSISFQTSTSADDFRQFWEVRRVCRAGMGLASESEIHSSLASRMRATQEQFL